MLLKSLLYSSKLEIITSKRFTSFLYFIFGSSILFWWYTASNQFLRAYIELGEFDVPVSTFVQVTLISFLPFVSVGAFMVSNVIRRFRLNLWIKSQITYADYGTDLSPAAAGMLVDYEYSNEEVWATLLQLHYSGLIHMAVDNDMLIIYRVKPLPEYSYERALLDNILPHRQTKTEIKSVVDNIIIRAGHNAHKILESNLASQGVIDLPRLVGNKVKWAIRLLFFFAGYIGIGLLYYYIFKNDIVTNILYPRYPVEPIELVADATVWIVAITIIVSGFWPRFKVGHKNSPSTMNLKAAGFYHYLKNTYKSRFETNNIQHLATSDIKSIAPYMVAYKLIELNENNIQLLIQHSDVPIIQ